MVPVWSSGFIVGTLAVRHAPGLSILFWRMSVAALVMGAIAMALRAPWPRERAPIVQMVVVGLLLQAAQFVGIFLALQHGVPAGLTVLLAGSSPLLVAPIAAFTQGFSLSAEALAPLAWLIFGLSIGAVMLFFWLLRNEKSGEATSFLYLVPATTAIAGVPILGQPLSIGAVVGLVFALIGVRMVSAPAEGLSSGEWLRRIALPGRLNREST